MLKLTLQHSKNGYSPLPPRGRGGLWSAEAELPPDAKTAAPLSRLAGEGDYGVRKRSFRPMLKLTLQHSKTATPLSHSVGEGLGVRANA